MLYKSLKWLRSPVLFCQQASHLSHCFAKSVLFINGLLFFFRSFFLSRGRFCKNLPSPLNAACNKNVVKGIECEARKRWSHPKCWVFKTKVYPLQCQNSWVEWKCSQKNVENEGMTIQNRLPASSRFAEVLLMPNVVCPRPYAGAVSS